MDDIIPRVFYIAARRLVLTAYILSNKYNYNNNNNIFTATLPRRPHRHGNNRREIHHTV